MKKLFSIILLLLWVTNAFAQTKKKNAPTSTTKSCQHCGKKFSKINGYVVPLGSMEGGSYRRQMSDISLVRKTFPNYPEENIKFLEVAIKNGYYFCSEKCLYSKGYRILE